MINSLQNRAGILQDRFAYKTASHLTAATAELPYEVAERLRAARMQALAKRKPHAPRTASVAMHSGAGLLNLNEHSEPLSVWARIASVLPLLVLVVGLLAINSVQGDNRAREIAEVDAALLTDVLPPEAFADPGFVQFLKSAI